MVKSTEFSVIIERSCLSTSELVECELSSLMLRPVWLEGWEEVEATAEGLLLDFAGESPRLRKEDNESSGSHESATALDGELGGVGRCLGGV